MSVPWARVPAHCHGRRIVSLAILGFVLLTPFVEMLFSACALDHTSTPGATLAAVGIILLMGGAFTAILVVVAARIGRR